LAGAFFALGLYFLHSTYPSLLEVFNHGVRLKRRIRQHILKVNDGEDNGEDNEDSKNPKNTRSLLRWVPKVN
jgi:hypothetical protein